LEKLTYFPGCTLKDTARDFEISGMAVMEALGYVLEELERWNCCGTVFSLTEDDLMHQVAPVRDLLRAQEAGSDEIITLCSMCYATLKRASLFVNGNQERLDTINAFMNKEIDYEGKVSVHHLLEVMRDRIGWDRIEERITNPLEGLSVAPFYGCTLLRPKEIAIELSVGSGTVRIGGMAKGAGMIYPRLEVDSPLHATMLAFITTDAALSASLLRETLSRSVNQSFNRVSVDGDTSTNDSVILLANGRSGVRIGRAGKAEFQEALDYVTSSLARMIAADGEGATKFIELEVKGARSHRDAERAAAAVANSVLFKCALYGRTPNWGRILAALGYSGAGVREDRINIFLEDVPIVRQGVPVEGPVRALLGKKDLKFTIDLGSGKGRGIYYTCDLTPEYVEINKS